MCYFLLEYHWFCYRYRFECSMLVDLLLSTPLSSLSPSSLPMSSNTSYLKNTTKHENSLCIAFSLIFGAVASIRCLFCRLRQLPSATFDGVENLWASICFPTRISNKIIHVSSTNVLFLFLFLFHCCCCCCYSFISWQTLIVVTAADFVVVVVVVAFFFY